jgi:nicotinamidase-related amidase
MAKHLLVIDIQKQFKGEKYEDCINFINNHLNSYDSIVATMFINKINKNSNYKTHLNYEGCKDYDFNNIEFYNDSIKVIEKTGYGLNKDKLNKLFKQNDQIDIIGCDGDACVLATCFQLWDSNYTNFRILSDYIYTTSDTITKDMYEAIMQRNFGDCLIKSK